MTTFLHQLMGRLFTSAEASLFVLQVYDIRKSTCNGYLSDSWIPFFKVISTTYQLISLIAFEVVHLLQLWT